MFSMPQYNTFRDNLLTPRVNSFCVQSNTMKTVGDRIRQARVDLKLTGAELAKNAGYKRQSAIGNLENRATGTGGNKINDIADALGVSVEWLLRGPDGPTVPFLRYKFEDVKPSTGNAGNKKQASLSVQEPQTPLYPDVAPDGMALEMLKLFNQLDRDSKLEFIGQMRGFVLGRIGRNREPPEEQITPANNERTGTHD